MSIWIQEQAGNLDGNGTKVTADKISLSNVLPQFYRINVDAYETIADSDDQHGLRRIDVQRTNENKGLSSTSQGKLPIPNSWRGNSSLCIM